MRESSINDVLMVVVVIFAPVCSRIPCYDPRLAVYKFE